MNNIRKYFVIKCGIMYLNLDGEEHHFDRFDLFNTKVFDTRTEAETYLDDLNLRQVSLPYEISIIYCPKSVI